jgi:hypothetical protein
MPLGYCGLLLAYIKDNYVVSMPDSPNQKQLGLQIGQQKGYMSALWNGNLHKTRQLPTHWNNCKKLLMYLLLGYCEPNHEDPRYAFYAKIEKALFGNPDKKTHTPEFFSPENIQSNMPTLSSAHYNIYWLAKHIYETGHTAQMVFASKNKAFLVFDSKKNFFTPIGYSLIAALLIGVKLFFIYADEKNEASKSAKFFLQKFETAVAGGPGSLPDDVKRFVEAYKFEIKPNQAKKPVLIPIAPSTPISSASYLTPLFSFAFYNFNMDKGEQTKLFISRALAPDAGYYIAKKEEIDDFSNWFKSIHKNKKFA